MMINLQKVETKASFVRGNFKEEHEVSLISINCGSIIEVQPIVSGTIRELNGQPCKGEKFTRLTYSLGTTTETITVLGEYSEIINRIKKQDNRVLLNG